MDVKVQRSAARAKALTRLLSIDFLLCQKPLFVHFLFPMNISFEILEFAQRIVSVLFCFVALHIFAWCTVCKL